jgi:hypothetical protein
MKTRFLIIVLCLACSVSFAQRKRSTKAKARTQATAPDPNQQVGGANGAANAGLKPADTTKKAFDRPLDGYYKKNNILSAKVTPYANLREADVMFAKRVWREIDLREKMNQYLASPKCRRTYSL